MQNDGTKTRILIYSDCSFFAGCENMPANLLNSAEIGREFDLFFAYRSSPAYNSGLAARVNSGARTIPLAIPSVESMLSSLERGRLGLVADLMRFTGLALILKCFFGFYSAFVLFFLFKRVNPDILHVNNGGYPGAYSCLAAVFAARAAGIRRIVFVVNNIAVPYERFTRRLEKGVDRLLARRVDLFITGSSYAGVKLREVLGIPRERTVTIPNGIAPRSVKENRSAVLERLGIQGNPVLLGTVAVLEPRKGHKYLLEALAAVKDKFPGFSEVRLLIEGDGVEKERLILQAKELGIAGSVLFLGREKNIFDILKALDVFILPSIGYEDFPNVILEAMSLGKPVIGTKVAGIPEQVLDGVTGYVVEPGDGKALADAILKMLSDPATRAEMGRRSLERFESEFSFEKAIGNYAGLYRKLG